MRLIYLCVVLMACGNKGESKPKDMGECTAISQDGKDFYLCEKTSSGPKAERMNEAELARLHAERQMAEALKQAREAQEIVEQLQKDMESLSAKVDIAVNALASAQNQADRDNAKAKLDELRKERAEIDARMAEARAKAARAERVKGNKVSKECLENPLAKGCS